MDGHEIFVRTMLENAEKKGNDAKAQVIKVTEKDINDVSNIVKNLQSKWQRS